MMFAPQNLTFIDHTRTGHQSPDLRRMEMINRARRDELNAMIHGMSPRTGFGNRAARRDAARGTTFGSKITGIFGNFLVSAGQRLQSVS